MTRGLTFRLERSFGSWTLLQRLRLAFSFFQILMDSRETINGDVTVVRGAVERPSLAPSRRFRAARLSRHRSTPAVSIFRR
jgi:hypothetical protein